MRVSLVGSIFVLVWCVLSLSFISDVSAQSTYHVIVGAEANITDLQHTPIWAVHRFYPSTMTVAVGDFLEFEFKTLEDHTVTWSQNEIDPLLYINGTITPYVAPVNLQLDENAVLLFQSQTNFSSGARNTMHPNLIVLFQQAGTYRLYCALHPHMQLLVTVQERGAGATNGLSYAQARAQIWQQIEADRQAMKRIVGALNLSFVDPVLQYSVVDEAINRAMGQGMVSSPVSPSVSPSISPSPSASVSPSPTGSLRPTSTASILPTSTASILPTSISTSMSPSLIPTPTSDVQVQQQSLDQEELMLLYQKFGVSTVPANMTSLPAFGRVCNSTNSSAQAGNDQAESGRRGTNHIVLAGIEIMNEDQIVYSSNRFYPSFLVIQVGDTVTFNVSYSMKPHLIIFNNSGIEPPPVLLMQDEELNRFGNQVLNINSTLLQPSSQQSTTFTGMGELSSGLLASQEAQLIRGDAPEDLRMPSSSFVVTFSQPGVFRFIDALYERLGMAGWIHVKERVDC